METPQSKLLVVLLGGAAVGAALAVLFAPAKGSETRSRIIEEAGGLKDVLTKVIQELKVFQSGASEMIQKNQS
jgi:gas vesicle protein